MMVFGTECNCPHHGKGILGYGPDDAEVMAIGIAPGRQEIKEGKPFRGPAGKRFDDVLRTCGFDRSRVYCSNLICWHNDSPTFDEIALCWPRLREEIEMRKPRLILALGALASEWLTGFKVGKVRGGIINFNDLAPSARLRDFEVADQVLCRLQGINSNDLPKASASLWIMPCWHPAATLGGRNPALVGDLVRDFKKIPRFLAGELDPIPFKHREVRSRREAQQILYWLSGRAAALDVETTFDTPEKWGRLLCLSISTYVDPTMYRYNDLPHPIHGGNYYLSYYFPREVLDDLDWPGSLRDGVRREGTLWGFHSGPFDRNVLRRELGVDLPIVWDSMYDSYACDERPGYDRDDRAAAAVGGGRNKSIGPGYHNLDQLAREYCLDGATRILTTELTWKPLSQVRVGETLIGFDESLPGERGRDCKPGRAMHVSAVESSRTVTLPRYRITTDRGEIISSPEHMWLARKEKAVGGPRGFHNPQDGWTQKYKWRRTEELTPGCVIATLCEPWEIDESKEAYYLKALFDGEGWLSAGARHIDVGFGQNDGPVAEYACSLLESRGFTFRKERDHSGCGKYVLSGERGALRFVGQIRPIRFFAGNKHRQLWEGRTVRSSHNPARVLSVERIEDGELVAVQTSTRTFIAEGMLSHNCGAGFFKDATKGWIGTGPEQWVPPNGENASGFFTERYHALRDRNALDAAYTMALPSRLPTGQRAPCYSTLLLPAANAYCDVSRTGIRIDVERLRALESDWSSERNSMEKRLEEWAADLGYTNPPKRKRDLSGEPFNPASTTQLAKLLFGPAAGGGLGIRSRVKTKKGKPSTSEEALSEIDHPFVRELMRLRKYANTLKYLPMIREHLRPDGRVHPTFLPLVTGRYSALDPAMQTFPQPYKLEDDGVPELAVLRSIIIPSEGMVLCATDYEQIEIWVAALLSQDPMMLADLREPFEGGKPNYHSRVTREVLKCQEEVGSAVWEKTRRGAKVFTFGIEFGEGPEGLAKNASKEMSTRMTKLTAARIIRDWYERYSIFAEWQRNQVRLARRQGYLENPFGFVRRFPFPDDVFKNQMYNSAIQGTASQHGTIALVELVDPMYFGLPYPQREPIPFQLSNHEPLHRKVGGNVLLTIHDEILCEVPEDRVSEGIAHIEAVMSHPRVPGWPGMQVSSKVGADWFSMKSWGH